jgi:hypothetical protein
MEKSEFTDHAGMCSDPDILASLDKARGGKYKLKCAKMYQNFYRIQIMFDLKELLIIKII